MSPSAPGVLVRVHQQRRTPMSWKAPKIVEVALGAEINAYACAEAKK
jgi:coenzyme PQQ precursor peptide PqqA